MARRSRIKPMLSSHAAAAVTRELAAAMSIDLQTAIDRVKGATAGPPPNMLVLSGEVFREMERRARAIIGLPPDADPMCVVAVGRVP